MSFVTVLFPHPDAPTNATTFPPSIVRFSPLNTGRSRLYSKSTSLKTISPRIGAASSNPVGFRASMPFAGFLSMTSYVL